MESLKVKFLHAEGLVSLYQQYNRTQYMISIRLLTYCSALHTLVFKTLDKLNIINFDKKNVIYLTFNIQIIFLIDAVPNI